MRTQEVVRPLCYRPTLSRLSSLSLPIHVSLPKGRLETSWGEVCRGLALRIRARPLSDLSLTRFAQCLIPPCRERNACAKALVPWAYLQAIWSYLTRVLESVCLFRHKKLLCSTQCLNFLFLSIQTRISDWREGALDSRHLVLKLCEADTQLKQYEESAAPPGWSCHWDRYCISLVFCQGGICGLSGGTGLDS